MKKHKKNAFTLVELMVVGVIVIILGLAFIGRTDSTGATRVLQTEGYKNIVITGYGYFKCSKDDTYSTSFTAINLAGNSVSGTVCSGFFKGNTIRLD